MSKCEMGLCYFRLLIFVFINNFLLVIREVYIRLHVHVHVLYIILSGKLKLCREERERIISEKNTESGVMSTEDRKHFSRSPSPGWKLTDGCLLYLKKLQSYIERK